MSNYKYPSKYQTDPTLLLTKNSNHPHGIGQGTLHF